MKNLAYLRVSIARQDVRSQRLAILEYAREQGFRIDRFIEAKASGRALKKHRRLDHLLIELTAGDQLADRADPENAVSIARSIESCTAPRGCSPPPCPIIAAPATLILWLLGLAASDCQWSRHFQANTERRRKVLSTVFVGQELWRNHRFKVTLAELFDALKRLKLLVIQEAQYA